MHLQAPKYLQWSPQLTPQYTSQYDTLITSGCSFTASTQQTDCAASWPGYVKDRLGLDLCIDMSFPGAGNRYIKDSIIYSIDNLDSNSKPLVIVMWSGIDRTEELTDQNLNLEPMAKIDQHYYKRVLNDSSAKELAIDNLVYIHDLSAYLNNKSIDHVFTTFINMTTQRLIPVRDTTPQFYKNISLTDQIQFDNLPFIVTGEECLYEWSFLNNYVSEDDFHPPVEANLKWTDTVLLKELQLKKYIDEI